ncbi:MAG: ligand-binding sensor domain-containing protein, partial [Limisphaerales bacterium]
MTANHFRNWAGLLLLLFAFSTVGRANPPWFTRVWQIDDGLLDNDINGITQGPDHYLWLVTPVGLMQFDGINFSPFPTEQLDRQATHIRIAFRGRGGILWLAFDGGKIIGLNPDFSRVSLENSRLPGRAPLALADDREGALWLGYPGSIYRIKAGQPRRLTARDGLPSGNFHSLSGDGAGNVWLAKGNQVGCFVDGTFRQIASILGVQAMGAARANAIWIAANRHLISCDVNGKEIDCGAFQGRSGARATALLEDRNGAVWIGTDGSGLFHYNAAGFTRVRTSHSTILSLAQDDEGNIWVGTGGGGLDRISPRSIQVETLENDHIQSQIQSICQDETGGLWGATRNGGLVRQIGGNWTPVFTNASFAGMVNCVAAGRSGAVWAGTRDGELLKIVTTNWIVCRTNIARGTVRGLF